MLNESKSIYINFINKGIQSISVEISNTQIQCTDTAN